MNKSVGVYVGGKLIGLSSVGEVTTNSTDLPNIGYHYTHMELMSINPYVFKGSVTIEIDQPLPEWVTVGKQYIIHREFDDITISPQP